MSRRLLVWLELDDLRERVPSTEPSPEWAGNVNCPIDLGDFGDNCGGYSVAVVVGNFGMVVVVVVGCCGVGSDGSGGN